MARFNKIRREQQVDPDINILPIMNMFILFIPLLLMPASFFYKKSSDTSIPMPLADQVKQPTDEEDKIKITVVVEIKKDHLRISALSKKANNLVVSNPKVVIPKPAGEDSANWELAEHLKSLKTQYPDSDTMILIPDDTISYREIIMIMDCARTYEAKSLFPKVVLSGTLG